MAASSEEEMFVNKDKKECVMCIFPTKTLNVRSFSVKTWTRFLEYVKKWKGLHGPQAEIAKNFDLSCDSTEIPPRVGFHQTCYARFTDYQKIERIQKKLEKNTDNVFEGKFKLLIIFIFIDTYLERDNFSYTPSIHLGKYV